MELSDDLIIAFKVRCPDCTWFGWSVDCHKVKVRGVVSGVLNCPRCDHLVAPVWKERG